MDITEWKNIIKKLNLSDGIKSLLINFFVIYHSKFSLDVIKIDSAIVSALNNINNYKPITICMDIEFQESIVSHQNKNKFITSKNQIGEESAKFVRELGILVFVKDLHRNWYYVGYIFVNFDTVENYGFSKMDIRLIGIDYSTVTDSTSMGMKINQKHFHLDDLIIPLENEHTYDKNKHIKIINNIIDVLEGDEIFNKLLDDNAKTNIFNKLISIKHKQFNEAIVYVKNIKKQLFRLQFEIYGKYLSQPLMKEFSNSIDMYWNDRLVKDRLKLVLNRETEFINIFSTMARYSVFVVKGTMDIIGIKNTSKLIFNTDQDMISFDSYYDIETFNGFSSNLYNSAQLEETFYGLVKSDLYVDELKNLFNRIKQKTGDKAHNPVVDSLFTIIVAIIINLGLNKYFMKMDKNRNTNINYYNKYMVYKNKYIELKNTKKL